MNSQSVKFYTLMLGKLSALARANASPSRIGNAANLTRLEFSESRIRGVWTAPIRDCEWHGSILSRGQAGNLSRSKFPAPKIETVENGPIRR